ncbi:MAG TPA: hypothetical protein VEZ55_07410 [Chitinophagaceae bacterium]|nr:hypothetical protein [Chitinophagaceae bacterium]
MLTRLYFLTYLLVFAICTNAQNYFNIPAPKDTAQFNKGLARTAWLLSSSTPQNKKEVRVLVYGQSISEQSWWKEVRNFFTEKYPHANINFINKAIGGFSSERLKLMVDNDVISFYPDLILFHDYGNEPDYEKIIQTIRSRTTADVALQTDHMAQQGQEWHDQHSNVWIPSISKNYGLAVIDVRGIWKEYLQQNKLQIGDLLTDGVHLNDHGNYLMAGIVKHYFNNLQTSADFDSHMESFSPGLNFSRKKKKAEVSFMGNRLDVIWKPATDETGVIEVIIDNNKPSSFQHCYYHTRPSLDSTSFLKKMGHLLTVQLTQRSKQEQWQLLITSVDTVQQKICFSLRGSVTGEDGSGCSDSLFTSRSGKIVIQPQFWFRRRSQGDYAQFRWVQPGETIQWQIRSMCIDQVKPQPSATTTLVQGLDNRTHVLRLKGKGVKDIQEIRVYQPPLR